MFSGRKLKQSTINFIAGASFFSVAVLLCISIYYVSFSVEKEREAVERRAELRQLASEIVNASDYLTEEARQFAITLDMTHLNNYWEEAAKNQTREKAVSRMGSIDASAAEQALLAQAKNNSDIPVKIEVLSMRLMLEVLRVPETGMPPAVAAFHLSPGDAELSEGQKMFKARDILFGADYVKAKRSVMEPILEFQTLVNQRTQAEVAKAQQSTGRAMALQFLLALVILINLAVLLRILRKVISKPIQNYTDLLRGHLSGEENKVLVPEGTEELCLLAESFNKSHTAMRLAKEEAEFANRAKSDFLAMMSHEIRTPMNGVVGMIDVLHRTEMSSKQQRCLEVISISAEALLNIINDILDVSKIEAGEITLRPEPFNLLETTEEIAQLMYNRARMRNIELFVRYSPGLPRVFFADSARIRQVLINLLGNAIKFTPSGYVMINIDGSRQAENMASLRLVVEDTGIGIARENLDKIFSRFTQLDEFLTRRFQGTGLGLTISRTLTELMNGRIEVESEQGKGSRFIIELSLPVVESSDNDNRGAHTYKVVVAGSAGPDEKILREYLEYHGAQASFHCAIQDALGEIKARNGNGLASDLLIVDCDLPGYDEVLAQDGLPAVALLASLEQEGELAVNTPPELILHKPLSLSQLEKLLEGLPGFKSREFESENGAQHGGQQSNDKDLPEAVQKFAAKVLVAEDHPINREVIMLVLSELGCKVDFAFDGVQAVNKFRGGGYDIIFMDCQMPDMDGYEATRAIRRSESAEGGHTPIIALTASALQQDFDKALQAGMDDYLLKPVKQSDIIILLEKYFPESSALPPFDETILRRQIGDNEEVVRLMLNRFWETHKQDLESLIDAVSRRDSLLVGKIAHRMKGSVQIIGAGALEKFCREIEEAAAGEGWSEADNVAASLRRESGKVGAYILKRTC